MHAIDVDDVICLFDKVDHDAHCEKQGYCWWEATNQVLIWVIEPSISRPLTCIRYM